MATGRTVCATAWAEDREKQGRTSSISSSSNATNAALIFKIANASNALKRIMPTPHFSGPPASAEWPPRDLLCEVLTALPDLLVVRVRSTDGHKTFEGALLDVEKK